MTKWLALLFLLACAAIALTGCDILAPLAMQAAGVALVPL